MPQETDHEPDELAALYREGASEQPPGALDAAILAAAEEALTPWYRRPAMAAISTAAVVVLAVGLILVNPDLGDPGGESFSPMVDEQLLSQSAKEPSKRISEPKPVTNVPTAPEFDLTAEPAPPPAEETPNTLNEIVADAQGESARYRLISLTSTPPPPDVKQHQLDEVEVELRPSVAASQQEKPNAEKRSTTVTDTSISTRALNERFNAISSLQDADSGRIAEVIATASYGPGGFSKCEDGTLQRFSPQEAAPLVICSFPDHAEVYAEGCDSPYRTDAAVTATVYSFGIKLTGEETAFRLRCERGRWFSDSLPVVPPPRTTD